MQIRLGDEDRELFGAPDEWLEFSVYGVTVADLEELSERVGFEPEDWPEPYFGEVAPENYGNPDAKRKAPKWQPRCTMWMALRQNGIPASWDDAGRARPMLARMKQSPGKESTSPSLESDPSTTQPSPTSSGSRRSTSTR